MGGSGRRHHRRIRAVGELPSLWPAYEVYRLGKTTFPPVINYPNLCPTALICPGCGDASMLGRQSALDGPFLKLACVIYGQEIFTFGELVN